MNTRTRRPTRHPSFRRFLRHKHIAAIKALAIINGVSFEEMHMRMMMGVLTAGMGK